MATQPSRREERGGQVIIINLGLVIFNPWKYGTEWDWGGGRSNLWTNKGIYPPQLQDNEYRGDLTPNNPGYHHTRPIWWQNMMSSSLQSNIKHSELSYISSFCRSIFHFVANVDWYIRKVSDIIQVLIWPMSRLWRQEKYSIERRHHLQCHDTNQDISGQMENIDGLQSARQRQIGISRVGLTFMNWNGWKMKGQNEAVNRADCNIYYMKIFTTRDNVLTPQHPHPQSADSWPVAPPDNIKNIPWNWERKPGQVQGLSFVIW